jgi:hypothetical protein
MTGFFVAGTFLVLALVFGAGSGTTPKVTPPRGRDPDPDPKQPGTGKITPGPNNEGPKPGPRGWGGAQYGPGPIPDDFDWNGNLIWISPDCKTIAEPFLFLPYPQSFQINKWHEPIFHDSTDVERTTAATLLQALLFFGPPQWDPPDPPMAMGTAWGFIGRMVAEYQRRGETPDAVEIATRVLVQSVFVQEQMFQGISPQCLNTVEALDTDKWSPAMIMWWETLVERVKYGINHFTRGGTWECCDDNPDDPFDFDPR